MCYLSISNLGSGSDLPDLMYFGSNFICKIFITECSFWALTQLNADSKVPWSCEPRIVYVP